MTNEIEQAPEPEPEPIEVAVTPEAAPDHQAPRCDRWRTHDDEGKNIGFQECVKPINHSGDCEWGLDVDGEALAGEALSSGPASSSTPSTQTHDDIDPMWDRVLVRPKSESDRTGGGVIKKQDQADVPKEGVALRVGTGHFDGTPMKVKVGDTVIFGKNSGSWIELGDEMLKILREDEIFAIRRTKVETIETIEPVSNDCPA